MFPHMLSIRLSDDLSPQCYVKLRGVSDTAESDLAGVIDTAELV